MALAQSSGEGFLTLLKKRNFLFLWLSQLFSLTIFNASNYALLILIKNTTSSTTLISLAIISFSIPAVLFGGPAGVFVDRMSKRQVLWISNCTRAVVTFLFVIALVFNKHALLPAYLLTFIIASISQFFTPAEGSTIPLLVSTDELMPALSLFNITFMLSQALGFVLVAPVLLSVLPPVTIFTLTLDNIAQLYLIVSIGYLLCTLLILAIPASVFKTQVANITTSQKLSSDHLSLSQETAGVFHKVWQDMLEGWKFVRQTRALFHAILQLSYAGILILIISLIASPIVTDLLKLEPNALAFVFAPAGVGLVIGSLFTPRLSQKLGRMRTMTIGIAVMIGATVFIPTLVKIAQMLHLQTSHTPELTIIVAMLMFIAGIGLDFVNIPANTSIQELTPDWIKGRVLALQLAFYSACSIPIILFLAALCDIYGIVRVLYLLAGLQLAFAVWNLYYNQKQSKAVLGQNEQESEQKSEEDAEKVSIFID